MATCRHKARSADWVRLLAAAVIGLSIDQWTKVWSFRELLVGRGASGPVSRVVEFIPGWLHFEVTENRGAVFGIGQGGGLVFIVLGVLATVFLAFLFSRDCGGKVHQVVMGLVLAGVLGNLIDRAALGHVRDMIHMLPRWPDLFPYIFNFADMLLCVGVGWLVLVSFLPSYRNPSDQEDQGKPGE